MKLIVLGAVMAASFFGCSSSEEREPPSAIDTAPLVGACSYDHGPITLKYPAGATFAGKCSTCICRRFGAVTCAPCTCDPAAEPWRTYYGGPIECQTISLRCPQGSWTFSSDCGCGCERPR